MEALWLGPETGLMERALLALQIRWPDAQLTSIPSAERLAEETVLETASIAFLHLGAANAADALESVQALRAVSSVPILVLVDPATESLDRVKALVQGADDVIPADSSPLDIQAHALALLRRGGGTSLEEQETPIQVGDILISPEAHTVHVAGEPVRLTPTEFRLLLALARRGGAVATHVMLQRAIWGEYPVVSSAILRKYVQRLRAGLGDTGKNPRRIITVPGIGYRLATPADTASHSVS